MKWMWLKIEERLYEMLREFAAQPEMIHDLEELKRIREYIEAGEAGLAFDELICLSKKRENCLSAVAGVKLIELGIMLEIKVDEHGKLLPCMSYSEK